MKFPHRNLIDRFGKNLIRSRRFTLNSRKYVVLPSGLEAMLMIDEMLTCDRSRTSLFSFRPKIRRLQLAAPRALLTHLADHATNNQSLCLLVWLRGLCMGHLGSTNIADLRGTESENERVRWRVACALRRMQAWSELREFEAFETNSRVLRILRTKPRNYNDRLHAFLQKVDSQPVRRSHSELVITKYCSTTPDRNEKPDWWIRRILERIRRLVQSQ